MVDQMRPQVWKKGQLAYWERMAVRVNILHQTHRKKVAKDLISMLSTLNDNSSEDMEQDLFATLLRTWVAEPRNDPTELKRAIQNQEHQAHQALLSSGNAEFKAWLEKARTQGLRGLFRNLRQRDIPWQRPFQDLPALDRLRAREERSKQLPFITPLASLRLTPAFSGRSYGGYPTRQQALTGSPMTS